jgi:alkylation response protein AidB-like acyl-CoA dehydrogenase
MKKMGDPYTRVIAQLDHLGSELVHDGRDAEEDETIRLLLAAVARFGQQLINEKQIDAEEHIPTEVLSAAATMGLFGLTIPQMYGGAGLSMKGTCRVIQALSEIDRSVGVTIGLHNGLGLRGLIAFGSEYLKGRYLPSLARGDSIACFAVTESEAGSDIAALRTTAVQDGHDLIVNGSKIYVTNGGLAQIATIVARTPDLAGSRRGHSMILIPLDNPGVTRDAEEHKLGIRGSSTCTLHFDNIRVSMDHILGQPSQGLDHLSYVLSWGRTLLAAGCLGCAQAAMEKTLAQVISRQQFKRPIAEFGMVREKIALMRSRLHEMECTIRLATRIEEDLPGSIIWESLVAKIFSSESAWQVADDAVQLHGGSGFIEETGVARYLRDVRITRIFEGANELLRFHLASSALTWDPLQFANGPRLADKLDTRLAHEATEFDNLRHRLAEALTVQRKTYGIKVFQRQMTQQRIADASIHLYVLLAVLARAHGECTSGRLDDIFVTWTRHAAHELCKIVRHNLEDLDDNTNELANQIATGECDRAGCTLKEDSA